MKGITPAQQRKIYACARECGMDNDLLHLVIKDITGHSSLKELSAMEACLVIDTMEGRQNNNSVKDAATPKQMCYIKDLMKQLGWVNEKSEPDMTRLDGMCKKYAKVDSKGVVTTAKAGKGKKVTITATATDGTKKKASIRIKIMKHAVTKE